MKTLHSRVGDEGFVPQTRSSFHDGEEVVPHLGEEFAPVPALAPHLVRELVERDAVYPERALRSRLGVEGVG